MRTHHITAAPLWGQHSTLAVCHALAASTCPLDVVWALWQQDRMPAIKKAYRFYTGKLR